MYHFSSPSSSLSLNFFFLIRKWFFVKLNETDFINLVVCIVVLVTHKTDIYCFNKQTVVFQFVFDFWLNSFYRNWINCFVWFGQNRWNYWAQSQEVDEKFITQTKRSIIKQLSYKEKLEKTNEMNQPMLLPDRFPKMLPLNGGFRYPASVSCVTVSKMQTVIKIIKDVTDRVANNILIFVCFFFFSFFLFYQNYTVRKKNWNWLISKIFAKCVHCFCCNFFLLLMNCRREKNLHSIDCYW